MSTLRKLSVPHHVIEFSLLLRFLSIFSLALLSCTTLKQPYSIEVVPSAHLHTETPVSSENILAAPVAAPARPVETVSPSLHEGHLLVSLSPMQVAKETPPVTADPVVEQETHIVINEKQQLDRDAQSAAEKVQPAVPQSFTVNMHSNLFHPSELTVPAGSTVRWDNGEAIPHTVTSKDGKFDSGLMMKKSDSWSYVFSLPGTYSYVCILHPAMIGKVTVQEIKAVAPVPSEKPAPTEASPSPSLVSEPGFPLARDAVVNLPPPSLSNAAFLTLGSISFSSPTLTISPGQTVFWLNTSHIPHAISETTGLFASEVFMPGTFFSYTFVEPGTYTYGCNHHAGMYGTIKVTGTALPEISTGKTASSPYSVTVSSPAPAPSQRPAVEASHQPALAPKVETAPQTASAPAASSAASTSAPSISSITMSNSSFSQASLNISVGQSMKWTNTSSLPHTVTASNGSFDSGIMMPGASFTFNFSKPGTFNYTCILHPGMNGSITATEVPATGTAAPASSPVPASDSDSTPVRSPLAPPMAPVETIPFEVGDFIAIGDTSFSPATLTVDPGRIVHFVNSTKAYHTVSAVNEAFNSGALLPGVTFSFVFTRPGTYQYICQLHPGMTGTITVAGLPEAAVTPSGSSGSVSMGNSSFLPNFTTVNTGNTVRWTNTSTLPHTVTASDGSFDSGILMPNGSFSRTFPQPGTFSYNCILHPGMSGSVLVTGTPLTGTPDTTPAPTPSPQQPGSQPLPPANGGNVTMANSSFLPASYTVTVGQTVLWSNTSSLPHTVTSGTGIFDSGILMPGSSFTYTFLQPGTYSYNCILHSGMSGTIAVTGTASPGTPAPTPAPPPGTQPAPAPAPNPPPSQPPPSGVILSVSVGDDFFSPASISISQGTAIRWTNNGRSAHTATAGNGSFNSGTLRTGQSYSFTFNTPGTYSYVCIFHNGMSGSVIVNASPTPTPPPGSPPAPTPAPTPPPPTAPQTAQMVFTGSQISPTTVTIRTGGSVTFINNDSTRHRVRYDGNQGFDSGDIQPGGSWTRTFSVAGTFTYYDARNQQITGTVRVQ